MRLGLVLEGVYASITNMCNKGKELERERDKKTQAWRKRPKR